jgi:GxxExxY protein
MNDADRDAELNRVSSAIIGSAHSVSNAPGAGFLEKVYENALLHELKKVGLPTAPQVPMNVYYDGVVVGEYTADILVEGVILTEIKAVKELNEVHRDQCMTYLKATHLRLCLLINFGTPRIEVKRIISGY